MTPLQRQSNKAQKIVSTICLTNGCRHKHITACRSCTSPELNYQQTIIPTGKEMTGDSKVIIYDIICQQIQATKMVNCKGNGHTYTLCQHAISGIWATVKALGKRISLCSTFKDAKRLLNLYKRVGGKIVKLVGESGFCYGVVSNGA